MTTSSRTVDINVTRCVLHPRCLHRQRLPLTGCVQLPNATALRAWVRLTWLDSSTAQSGWARMSTGTRPGGARIPLDGSVPAGGAQERLLQSPLGCQPSSARARSMASRGGLARGNLHGLAPPTDYGRTVGRTHAERSRFTNSSTVPWSSGCGEVVDRPDGATRPARPAVRRG